jgi:hypothetical protein
VLDRFRQSYRDFPSGRIIKSESPDFLIQLSPKRSIGVELTSLPKAAYNDDSTSLGSFLKDLASSLIKKEEKLAIYRKRRTNEYWLVIYADSIEVNVLESINLLSGLNLNSGFDRIFLFELFNSIVWELPHSRE